MLTKQENYSIICEQVLGTTSETSLQDISHLSNEKTETKILSQQFQNLVIEKPFKIFNSSNKAVLSTINLNMIPLPACPTSKKVKKIGAKRNQDHSTKAYPKTIDRATKLKQLTRSVIESIVQEL